VIDLDRVSPAERSAALRALPFGQTLRLGSPRMAKPRARAKSAPPIRITLGIDEAGRGPAVGPMVMAAVALDSRSAAALTRAGLCDSKTYGAGDDAHAIRSALALQIRARARFVSLIEVEHTEIDRRVARNELNVLERELAVRLIDRAPTVDRIIADGKNMFAALALRYLHFESHDRAEERHASVAAASVIAKVARDERFAQIRARYEPELGPIAGGGYSNAATRRWLRLHVLRYGRLPDETRLSWPHPYVEDLIGNVRPPGPQAELFG
jgi:ribonuclease HII